ncbi:hypothetical protein VPH35_116846 [Triticum aestivum]
MHFKENWTLLFPTSPRLYNQIHQLGRRGSSGTSSRCFRRVRRGNLAIFVLMTWIKHWNLNQILLIFYTKGINFVQSNLISPNVISHISFDENERTVGLNDQFMLFCISVVKRYR